MYLFFAAASRKFKFVISADAILLYLSLYLSKKSKLFISHAEANHSIFLFRQYSFIISYSDSLNSRPSFCCLWVFPHGLSLNFESSSFVYTVSISLFETLQHHNHTLRPYQLISLPYQYLHCVNTDFTNYIYIVHILSLYPFNLMLIIF